MRALRACGARGAAGRPGGAVAFVAPRTATTVVHPHQQQQTRSGSRAGQHQARGVSASAAASSASASASAPAKAPPAPPAPTRPPRPTSAASAAGAASWPLLYRASRVATFSGLCYVDTSAAAGPAGVAELERRAAAMGLRLVAHGRSAAAGGTSWVVGDATIDYAAFARRAGLSAGATPTAAATAAAAATGAAAAAGAAAGPQRAGGMVLPLAPPARRERFVLLRGVSWGARDADVIGLSAALALVWPAAYPSEGSELVAHAGVARLARALRAEVRAAALSGGGGGGGGGGGDDDEANAAAGDHEGGGGGDARRRQRQQRLPVVWAGHSLGGSLAKLLWVAELADGGGEQQRRRREGGGGAGDASLDGDGGGGGADDASSPLLPEVLTFGSPPVLAHAKGGGSAAMMRVLSRLASASASASSSSPLPPPGPGQQQQRGPGFRGRAAPPPASILVPETAVAQYVLEGDPVPRALLSADPTFASLQRNDFFSAALRLNQRLFGGGAPLTPGRFLFEALGVVKLVRWSASGGSEVVPLSGSAEEVARGLLAAASGVGAAAAKEAVAAAAAAAAGGGGGSSSSGSGGGGGGAAAAAAVPGWSPLTSVRAWLDHHHGSYTQELEAAAISALRAEQRTAALQRQQRGAQRWQEEEEQGAAAAAHKAGAGAGGGGSQHGEQQQQPQQPQQAR